MRSWSRTALLAVLPVTLIVTLTGPVSADQYIRYKGTTSATSYNRVHVSVVEREGRRRLNYIALHLTLTCEDATTHERIVVLRRRRLNGSGDFSVEVPQNVKGTYLRVDGSIRWAKGAGTVSYNMARLIEDGSAAQLCTTGDLTWTVERTGSHPYRLMS